VRHPFPHPVTSITPWETPFPPVHRGGPSRIGTALPGC
jgi:hypothetical protein